MESELEKIAYVYGDICVRTKKQIRKRQKLLVTELLFDYAKNSTLHGLRYIVERGLSVIEKLFWFTTVVASIVMCSFCIHNLYQKWITSPVIVTVNGRLSSVGMVPFPAVTICPQKKVKPSVYNYTEALRKYNNERMYRNGSLQEDDLIELKHISVLCDEDIYGYNSSRVTNRSIVRDITKVAPTLDDIFIYCSWYSNSNYNCKDLFSRVYTEDGVCYTANSLAATDIFENNIPSEYQLMDSNTSTVGWSPKTGYNYSVPGSYPKRGHILGSEPDLDIILTNDPENQDKSCNGLYSGYKIYLQHPADFPQSSLYYYATVPEQLTLLAISFHQFNTDKTLSSYPPEIRQCYFPQDKKLRYFKIYTMKNCQAECLTKYAIKHCNCVAFYMPHDNSTQICSSIDSYCINSAKEAMAMGELSTDLGFEQSLCHCLPECDTIEYDAEILKTEYNLAEKIRQYYKDKDIFHLYLPNSYSRIALYFKKPQFVTMQRRELFGVVDLLANIGGLLGVFLGFSFLSLVEILYFLTLRVGFTLKRDLEDQKKKSSKINDVKTN